MNWQDTAVFVNNRDNLDRGFRSLVRWLRDAGVKTVCVIDNASTWPPLLDFYQRDREFDLISLSENKGPYAFWELDMHKAGHPFIITDPDVIVPASCPSDLICRMHSLMNMRDAAKTGPSLRIDNLPDHYVQKQRVLDWESQFWQKPVGDGKPHAYEAQIDTTFALYKPGSWHWPEGAHLRMAPPYSIEHVPWYEDSSLANAEREHYHANAHQGWINW
jgi:hypothetical protein